MNKTILIVEDEKNIVDILKFNLTKENYNVLEAYDGEQGLKSALEGNCDLVLLDVMLPLMDGFEVLKRLRETSAVPVIMLTAKEEEVDKVMGLDLGADDYVTKPFKLKELLSRIKANLRRTVFESTGANGDTHTANENSSYITCGDLLINKDKYDVLKKGEHIDVTLKEYELLKFLAQNPGKVFTREELLEQVWGYDNFYGDVRAVDVMISRLRKKMEENPAEPVYIRNRRGAGYYLNS